MIFLLQAVAELGFVIYTSLDFGLNDGEERQLSPGIENLLDLMTSLGKTTALFLPASLPKHILVEQSRLVI